MTKIKWGTFLKQKRAELGLTTRQAGELVGVSCTAIFAGEKVKYPKTSNTVKQYQKAYGLTDEEINQTTAFFLLDIYK
jgi:DNA-binding XRE family transcriptional regulator